MAIWLVQFVGREIRILDYIEGVGQLLGYYANELKSPEFGRMLYPSAARWRGGESTLLANGISLGVFYIAIDADESVRHERSDTA
jgi:hypothetical protein